MGASECFVEVDYNSLSKKGEELCGDKVEIFQSESRTIIVLADGLGSGVKANILATLTSKIAITMIRKGANIEEVIETIAHTLPVCKVRKIAYSTFSIIEIDENMNCKIFESENPPFFFLRKGKIIKPAQNEVLI
nr:SpoIIE family protein phosphatase [Vallitaleaceae bacterium]